MRMFCPFIPMNSLLWSLTWPNQTRVTALPQINLVSIIYFHVYINENNSLIYMYCPYSSYHHLKVKHFSGWKSALLLHFARIYGRIISNCINFHKIHIWHLRLGPTVWSCSKNALQWNRLASMIQELNTPTWEMGNLLPHQELFVPLKRKAEVNVWLLLILLMISVLLNHELCWIDLPENCLCFPFP